MGVARVGPYVPAAAPESPRACRMAGEIGLLAVGMWMEACSTWPGPARVAHRCPDP